MIDAADVTERGMCGWFRAMLNLWKFDEILVPLVARPFN
jgi:hypothetical protein